MRNFIAIAVICFVGCISADRSHREIKISKYDIPFDLSNSYSSTSNDFNITITCNTNNSIILEKFIYKYFAETNEAGLNYFFDHYYVCLMTVKNTSNNQKEFILNNLEIWSNNVIIHLVDIKNLPKEVKQFNPNNLTKDVYNGILTTALILATLKTSGPDIPFSKYFDSVFNTKDFSYENIFKPKNVIKGKGCIDGIIFVNKSDVNEFKNIQLVYR